MPKDDYFYIVYKILKHLYKELKHGKTVYYDSLSNELELHKIEVSYWEYIIKTLFDEKYVTGDMEEHSYIDEPEPIFEIVTLQITPKGIEYLQENSSMKKIASILKGTAEVIGNIK